MIITAIIPIKHNSSRVPGKNFKHMNGRELYRWIVDTLLKVDIITTIIIDTDSDKIFEDIPKYYPEEYGKRIILHRRPEELHGDDVSTNDIFKHVITSLSDGNKADYYFQTHATNPLLKSETITDFIQSFIKNKDRYDSAFSVKRHHTRFYTKHGEDMNHDRKVLIPTQDLDPIFEENSCMYIFTERSLVDNNARIADNAMMYEMSDMESQDIDWPDDFVITEVLMKQFYLENSR